MIFTGLKSYGDRIRAAAEVREHLPRGLEADAAHPGEDLLHRRGSRRDERRGLQLAAPPRRVGKTGDHLQLTVRQGQSTMKAIAFNAGDLFDRLTTGVTIDLAFEPTINEFNGFRNVELEVKDLQFTPP